jgi:hypothetical protein
MRVLRTREPQSLVLTLFGMGKGLVLARRTSGLAGRPMTEAVEYSSDSYSFAILRGYIAQPYLLHDPIERDHLFGISGPRQPAGKGR